MAHHCNNKTIKYSIKVTHNKIISRFSSDLSLMQQITGNIFWSLCGNSFYSERNNIRFQSHNSQYAQVLSQTWLDLTPVFIQSQVVTFPELLTSTFGKGASVQQNQGWILNQQPQYPVSIFNSIANYKPSMSFIKQKMMAKFHSSLGEKQCWIMKSWLDICRWQRESKDAVSNQLVALNVTVILEWIS